MLKALGLYNFIRGFGWAPKLGAYILVGRGGGGGGFKWNKKKLQLEMMR